MSYRPPKKKDEFPTDKGPVIDLRKEASEPLPTAEERLWLFWNNYGNKVMVAALLLVGSILAAQGYQLWEKKEVEKMQVAYQNVGSQEDQISFALTYENKPLAGVVFLELADKAYNDKDYSSAGRYYEEAAEALGDHPLGARAALGSAIIFMHQKDAQSARKILNALLQNKNTLNAYRAAATYQLATLAAEEEKIGQALALIHQVEEIPFNGIWAYKARVLKQNLPEDKKA